MTKFYLVRHGETLANKLNLMQGISNSEFTQLTVYGRSQCLSVRNMMDVSRCELVVSSPLNRAVESAKIIMGNSNIKYVEDEELAEKDYGALTGLPIADVDVKEDSFPDLERAYTVKRKRRLEQKLKEYVTAYPNGNILMVSHGWTISLILSIVLGIKDLKKLATVDNGSISEINMFNDEKRWVTSYNWTRPEIDRQVRTEC